MSDPGGDYRAFIRNWLSAHRSRSQRGLARRLGLAPSLVSMVLAGKRALQVSETARWAEAMRLDDQETQLFEALVQQEHAPTDELRRQARSRVAAIRLVDLAQPRLTSEQLRQIMMPPCPIIVELARCPGFRFDPAWVASKLHEPVPVQEVAELLEMLATIGVLYQRPEGGWAVDDRPIATEVRHVDATLSPIVREIHEEHLQLARSALDTPEDQRHFGLLVAAVPASRLPELYLRLSQAMISMGELYGEDTSDVVVQIGFQVVPRTR